MKTALARCLAALVISCFVGAAARGQSPAAAGTMTVDRVEVVGTHDVRDEIVRSALDLPLGTPLTRDELDQRLERGRQRLNALGYFESVDIGLVKGKERGHVDVKVELVAHSSSYVGLSLKRNARKDRSSETSFHYVDDVAQLFVGSRSLLGTGLRSELSLWHWEAKEESDWLDAKTIYGSAQLSLYEPAILGSPWFAGMTVGYLESRRRDRFENHDNVTYASNTAKSFGHHRLILAAAGRRFGLYSASVSAFRIGGAYRYMSDSTPTESDEFFATRLASELRYSDKTGLTNVEAGTLVAIVYERDVAPDWYPPAILATGLHTLLWRAQHALTPKMITEHAWNENSDGNVGLDRTYDLSLTYEYVTLDRIIFGVTYGELNQLNESKDTSYYLDNFPQRRWRWSVGYNANGFILDLAFLYGETGLDRSNFDVYLPDHARFTQ